MATGSISDTTSSSFIELVKMHSSQAWQHLSRLYGPLVYRWARQSGLQESDAADVTQEVFHVVIGQVQTFDKGRGTRFRAWLWGITRNKLREHFRQNGVNPKALGGSNEHQFWQQLAEVPAQEPNSADSFDADAVLIHRALELIRPDYADHTWEAFWRCAINAERSDRVARELNMTTDAVRQAKCRILKRLRRELEDGTDS
jgi:RNA polymerase sigma-70 factor, ECF subfamily